MAEVSTLWPVGTLNASPFAIQAPKWFNLGRRAHEKGTSLMGSAPGAAGSLFLSLEVCTVIIITNNINDYSIGHAVSPPRWGLCSLHLFLFLLAGPQMSRGQLCPADALISGHPSSSPLVLSGDLLKR